MQVFQACRDMGPCGILRNDVMDTSSLMSMIMVSTHIKSMAPTWHYCWICQEFALSILSITPGHLHRLVQAWATGNALDTVQVHDFGGFVNSSQQKSRWLWNLGTWHFKQQPGNWIGIVSDKCPSNCKGLAKSTQDPKPDLTYTHKYGKIPWILVTPDLPLHDDLCILSLEFIVYWMCKTKAL